MGLTAERVARHYGISREDQDAFALASHQKGRGRAGRRALCRGADSGDGDQLVPGAKAGKPVMTETSLFRR